MNKDSQTRKKEKDTVDIKKQEPTTIWVTCHRCGRKWPYGGLLAQATCPNCGYKTPTGLETHVVE